MMLSKECKKSTRKKKLSSCGDQQEVNEHVRCGCVSKATGTPDVMGTIMNYMNSHTFPNV